MPILIPVSRLHPLMIMCSRTHCTSLIPMPLVMLWITLERMNEVIGDGGGGDGDGGDSSSGGDGGWWQWW